MASKREDIEYLEYIFSKFYDIGANSYGGVTRLGYSKVEDEMHEMFKMLGESEDFNTYIDEVGNTYIANDISDKKYYLMGSHLDSVVNGGRYDGVAGVIAGLLILKWAKDEKIDIPIRVGAFRCEESSNFGKCTIGSGLITGELSKDDVKGLISKTGKYIVEVFNNKGYSFTPKRIENIKQYIELHIEQGKVLEEYGIKIGIVSDIAGPRRFEVSILGEAEHSGATPMDMRADALCAASEFILELEKLGKMESYRKSVTTVGVINNGPNVLNVIPGEVTLGVDIRGIDIDSLDIIENGMKNTAKEVSQKRDVKVFIQEAGRFDPVKMSSYMQKKLIECSDRLKVTHKVMPSGAGHDAMAFSKICDSSMVFIPCYRGISHNKSEFSSLLSIYDGAKVIYEYLKGEM
ncbi:hydantoinase/carbamoylase family amidase [Romboutsia sedimentorum]|uniref:Hydantoinase/carbamoylase family amidase n=1 Tax=Romboutsia sedimentorum TaxID=1368474 RepID=A0ABT7EA83_9FIRM|nr:hydantoinase/carbamoylase family amidase [Romboutsia sedimentorum]MDK2563837.1 hydantoinase/carbamoylase family amidase [Romboutsia sedimentorum]MDK2585423.1 hydantoinase/carbamoylase family amidase [Romboutsia sedimentorum]